MKRFFAIALGLAALAGAGYAGYWHYLAAQIAPAVSAWAEAQRGNGYRIAFEEVAVTGFPGPFQVRIAKPVLGRPDAASPWEWRAEAVLSTSGPITSREVDYQVPDGGRLTYAAADGLAPAVATSRVATGRIALDERGEPNFGELALQDLRIALPAGDESVEAARALLEARHLPASGPAARDGRIAFSWTLDEVRLPAQRAGPLGPRVARFAASAQLEGTGPELAAQTGTRAAVTAWRDGDGRLVIRAFELDWGPLRVSLSGTVSLDPEMRPAGQLDTAIRGYRETTQTLVQAEMMKPKDAATALVVLDLLSKRSADGGARVLQLPVTARDGQLSVGPMPLATLPPLDLPD
ncbi:MAG: DUF2125 domain-containing protein [Alphaproteobacteria bacterium]|nr:DUF2125 domain-containing protein [Alphaproteobacteria bacterium]